MFLDEPFPELAMDPKPVPGADPRVEMPALCAVAIDMLRQTKKAFTGQQPEALDTAERLGRELHDSEKVLTEQIVRRIAGSRMVLEADHHRLFVPMHLERIGDHIELLMRALRTMLQEGTPFTDRARREVDELIDQATAMLVNLRDLLLTSNEALRQHVIDTGRLLVARADDVAGSHQRRLIEGVCVTRASSIYLAMLDAIKGVEWHAREIAQKLEHPTAADLRDVAAALKTSAATAVSGLAGADAVQAAAPARPSPVGWVP
jgi:Na+/phosphate symporter